MIKVTSDVESANYKKWSDFIIKHPLGNFYQSYEYYKSLQNEKNYKPYVIIALENETLVGVLVYVIQKEALGPLSSLSARAIIQGGPLAKDNNQQIIERLILEFNKQTKRKAVYSQFRNLFDTNMYSEIMEKYDFYFEEHLNILIDLKKTEEQLWKDVHTKRRNEIRKARKLGTEFFIADDSFAIEGTYPILNEVYSRAKLPLPSQNFFQDLYNQIGGQIFRVFIVKNEDRIIGVMYTFCYKDTIFDWYAGALSEYYNKYPNDLIPWEVFLWGQQQGFSRFDFGGAGKPNVPYGVRDYKKKFGGEFVNFGRYERINQPIVFNISKTAFKFLRYVLFK